jgi:hypothetical protein
MRRSATFAATPAAAAVDDAEEAGASGSVAGGMHSSKCDWRERFQTNSESSLKRRWSIAEERCDACGRTADATFSSTSSAVRGKDVGNNRDVPIEEAEDDDEATVVGCCCCATDHVSSAAPISCRLLL